jgi:steroid 5-alpha reductase family enzyme
VTRDLLAGNAVLVAALMTTLWLWSVVRRDAGVVDPWWSMGFLFVSVRSAWVTGASPGKWLLVAVTAAWAVRLWLHLLLRARGRGEDPRYVKFRKYFGAERYWWVSFFQVFVFQGVMMLLISSPLVVAAAAPAPDPLRWNDVAGAIVALAGLGIETIADRQLQRFRDDPERGGRGAVLATGLWRYSRHPNYFGETLVMWGLWIMAADAPGALYTAFAPALMTFFLLRVSGVTMLESQLVRTKPGYAEYVRRTSSFVIRPPRRG